MEMEETEQINLNKIKEFGETAKRETIDCEAFETARFLSHDSMEETIPWSYPKVIEMTTSLVHWGSSSREKSIQAVREELMLQEIFRSKDSIPDSPHEPDPESYIQIPPKLIPLDEVTSVGVAAFQDATYQGSASGTTDGASGLELLTATANMMDSVRAAKGQTLSISGKTSNSLNVQESQTLIKQGAQGNPKLEGLLKQSNVSDYIKQILESLLKQPGISDYIKQLLVYPQSQPPTLPEGSLSKTGFYVQKQPEFSNYIKQLLGSLQSQPPVLPEGSLLETGFCIQKQPDVSNSIKELQGSIQRQPHITPEEKDDSEDLTRQMMSKDEEQVLVTEEDFGESAEELEFKASAGVGLRGPTLLPNGFPSVPMNRLHFPPGNIMLPSRGVLVDPFRPVGPCCPVVGQSNSGKGGNESRERGHDRNCDRNPDQGYTLCYDGSYDGGHEQGHGRDHVESHGDMSTRSVCRHFMMKGKCRYEHNCAFYHPGVNGPPQHSDSDVSKQSKCPLSMKNGNRLYKHKGAFDHPVNGPPLPRDTGLNGPPLPRDIDMSTRSVCCHFMKLGYCRYEQNCAFYHPGVNGPPLLKTRRK